jgi:ornithine carbamoyltransferase
MLIASPNHRVVITFTGECEICDDLRRAYANAELLIASSWASVGTEPGVSGEQVAVLTPQAMPVAVAFDAVLDTVLTFIILHIVPLVAFARAGSRH